MLHKHIDAENGDRADGDAYNRSQDSENEMPGKPAPYARPQREKEYFFVTIIIASLSAYNDFG